MTEKLRELKTYNERIRGCKIERGLQRKKSKGTKGTIDLLYDDKNCEVEFFDKDGDTIDVVMIPLKKLEIIESF